MWRIFGKPKILARDVFETSQRRHGKDIFFEICPRRLKDVTQKTSFSDVFETSLLRCFWEISEISLSMEIWLRSLRETSHGSWEFNKIENRITFKIETWYYLELLTLEIIKLLVSTKGKITEDKNDEKVLYLDVAEVVLIHIESLLKICSNLFQMNH